MVTWILFTTLFPCCAAPLIFVSRLGSVLTVVPAALKFENTDITFGEGGGGHLAHWRNKSYPQQQLQLRLCFCERMRDSVPAALK